MGDNVHELKPRRDKCVLEINCSGIEGRLDQPLYAKEPWTAG